VSLLQFLTEVLPNRKSRRAWVYRRMNDFHRRIKTTNRRYELELVYLEKSDPWDYKTSKYEAKKYRRGLKAALQWRRGRGRALEIGCSIGMFTRMLPAEFDEVTAVDISEEAIALARREVNGAGHVDFVRADIRKLRLGKRYDVIFVSEMLYYLPRSAKAPVMNALRSHLSPDGVVILVSGRPSPGENFLALSDWKPLFIEEGFNVLADEDIDNPFRPYVIQVFDLPAQGSLLN
jgi:2-polyprenyl-3-methyl-5-hydroxy-6-metoxy-1,4-benzoquinol methylase